MFLLSRVREEWRRRGDSRPSVAEGLAGSPPRSAPRAAAIVVFVLGSFILEHDRPVKLIGVGPATATLLDATIVRMLLVPATVELLGDRNWWLPRWLGRFVPDLDVEGGAAPTRRDEELAAAAGPRARRRRSGSPDRSALPATSARSSR